MAMTYMNVNGTRRAELVVPKGAVKIFSRPLNRPEEAGPDKGKPLTWCDRKDFLTGKRSYGSFFQEEVPGGHPGFFYVLQQEKRRLGFWTCLPVTVMLKPVII